MFPRIARSLCVEPLGLVPDAFFDRAVANDLSTSVCVAPIMLLVQSLKHQVSNATIFLLFYYVVGSVELDSLLLYQCSLFCDRGLALIAYKHLITEVHALVEPIKIISIQCDFVLLGTKN
jgi:hypothetical protein